MHSKNNINSGCQNSKNRKSHLDDLKISFIPAEKYEATKKLAYTWIMPSGYSEDLLWTIFSSMPSIHELQKICNALAEMNPEIKNIIDKEPQNIGTYRDIVGGVSSKFAPEDIAYYAAIKSGSRENDNNTDVQAIIKPHLQSITIDYNEIHDTLKEIYNDLIFSVGTKEKILLLANDGSLSYDEHTAFSLYLEHMETYKSFAKIFENKPVLLFRLLQKIWGEKNNCKIERCISPSIFFTKCYGI